MQVRQRVGMVFQRSNPFPKSIFENVAYALRVAGVHEPRAVAERVEIALRQADLWNEVKDRLGESGPGLSGGQQQRLCIARALAVGPEVLLMDEPASALDPIATAKVEDLISELKKRLTIVIVTHNMQQAARVSQRTGFFYRGAWSRWATRRRSSRGRASERPKTTSRAGSADASPHESRFRVGAARAPSPDSGDGSQVRACPAARAPRVLGRAPSSLPPRSRRLAGPSIRTRWTSTRSPCEYSPCASRWLTTSGC